MQRAPPISACTLRASRLNGTRAGAVHPALRGDYAPWLSKTNARHVWHAMSGTQCLARHLPLISRGEMGEALPAPITRPSRGRSHGGCTAQVGAGAGSGSGGGGVAHTSRAATSATSEAFSTPRECSLAMPSARSSASRVESSPSRSRCAGGGRGLSRLASGAAGCVGYVYVYVSYVRVRACGGLGVGVAAEGRSGAQLARAARQGALGSRGREPWGQGGESPAAGGLRALQDRRRVDPALACALAACLASAATAI